MDKLIVELNNIQEYIDLINSKKRFFVKFYTTWCRPCKNLSNIIPEVMESVSKLDSEILLVNINAESFPKLNDIFNITTVPHMALVEPIGNFTLTEGNLTEMHLKESIKINRVLHVYDADEMTEILLTEVQKSNDNKKAGL